MKHVEEQVELWMAEKRTTLWGRSFDINQPESRRQAAEWFVAQVDALVEWDLGEANDE